MSQKSITVALQHLMHDLEYGDSPEGLRSHPGLAFDILNDGIDAQREWHAGDKHFDMDAYKARVTSEYRRGELLCDSPIERNMLAALLTAPWAISGAEPPLVQGKDDDLRTCPVLIIPQFQIGGHRLDFAIVADCGRGKRIVAVECDGAAYHDVDADRARDRRLESFGVPTFRAPGKAIVENALGIAARFTGAVEHWAAQ